MTFQKQFCLFFACLFTAGMVHAADPYEGQVIAVTGGDTITVRAAGNKQHQIRLHGINAPEESQAFSDKAKQFTSRLCLHKRVTVTVEDWDRDGRELATVVLATGESLNQKLVAAGYAWSSRGYAPKDKALFDLEKKARDEKLGLWSDPNAERPWEWRRSEKGEVRGEPGPSAPRIKTFTFYNPVTAERAATTDPNAAAQYLSKGWMLESAERRADTNRPSARIQRSTDAD